MRAADNPFAVQRLHALLHYHFPPGEDWALLEARLAALGGRGAIVGPRGHGKSTLLAEWEEHWRQAGHVVLPLRLAESRRHLSAQDWADLRRCVAQGGRVTVDGAEQLPPLAWWRLRWACRRAPVLVITTHRSGRLPTLYPCRTSPALLAELAGRLLDTPPEPSQLEALHRIHQGDLRAALRQLYDDYAAHPEPMPCATP